MNTYEPRTAFGKAMRQTYKIKKIFYNLLESFGYQDITIKIKPYHYSKEHIKKDKELGFNLSANLNVKNDDFYYLSPVIIYFWDNNFGYELHLDCDSCYMHRQPVDILSDESTEFLLNWLIIIKFLSNRESLRYFGMNEWDATKEITKQIATYLQDNGFNVDKIFSTQRIYLDKNNQSYSIMLRKTITQNEYNHDFDDDEPLEYEEEDIKPFREFFTTELEKLGMKNYNIYLYPDLGRLSVQINLNGANRQIDILSYHDVLYDSPELEEMFEDILYYYINDIKQDCNEMLTEMQNNGFHIYSCNDDCSEIFAYKYGGKFEIRTRSKVVFDDLEGHKFEHFCANVLRQNGFKNVSVTSGSGDQGIDIIAYKDDIKYGIQCKCYHSDIGNKAVQEVYAGKAFYNCHIGIVLTNRDFTRSAIELARNNGVILWNRTKLLQMISNCKDII